MNKQELKEKAKEVLGKYVIFSLASEGMVNVNAKGLRIAAETLIDEVIDVVFDVAFDPLEQRRQLVNEVYARAIAYGEEEQAAAAAAALKEELETREQAVLKIERGVNLRERNVKVREDDVHRREAVVCQREISVGLLKEELNRCAKELEAKEKANTENRSLVNEGLNRKLTNLNRIHMRETARMVAALVASPRGLSTYDNHGLVDRARVLVDRVYDLNQ
jgi:hypothetical protein